MSEKAATETASLSATLENRLPQVALIAALALRIIVEQAVPALLLVGLVTGLLFLFTRPRILNGLLSWLPAHGRWGRVAQGTTAIFGDARLLLSPWRLLSGLVLGVLAWGAEAWGFYLLLGWLGVDVGLWQAMGIYALGMLAGAASFLPGGLGGAEAAMVALLTASGAAFGTAVLATVICRAVTLWFAVVLGIAAVLLLGHRDA